VGCRFAAEVQVAPRSGTGGKSTTRTPSSEGHGGTARPDIPVVLCIGIATAPRGFGHRGSSAGRPGGSPPFRK
jgi:hypothetical protein